MSKRYNLYYAEPKKNWVLYISFQENEVKCSDIDFSEFVDDFSEFPDISH